MQEMQPSLPFIMSNNSSLSDCISISSQFSGGEIEGIRQETSPSSTNDPRCVSDFPASCEKPPKAKSLKESPSTKPAVKSLDLISNYRLRFSSFFNGEYKTGGPVHNKPTRRGRRLTTEEVMRVAATHFIHSSSVHIEGNYVMEMNPLGSSFSGLNEEEAKSVDLTRLLLAAAEKASTQQYDDATDLLDQCYGLSSSTGNPVQRVVYYFSIALQERIDLFSGLIPLKGQRKWDIQGQDVITAILNNDPMKLVVHKKMPFSQIMQFISIQTIIDSVGSSKRIHVIDLSIRHGVHWTILMQALSERQIDYLKITAIGQSKDEIAATGKWLASFAKTLGLRFFLEMVISADLKDLKEDMFKVEEGETIVAYSSMYMNTTIGKPEGLEHLMRVLQRLRPSVIITTDVEAKHNSPSFINRFTEALFYHSALFDCLDDSMERDDGDRIVIESCFMLPGIKSIIATEGSERVVRHVGIGVWRSFFKRFGLVEGQLSEWSSYQAGLLAKQFANGSSCTMFRNEKSLMVGWKGTPMFFVSAWRFQ